MDWLKRQDEHDAVLVAATKEFVKVTIYSGSRVGACVHAEIVFPKTTQSKAAFTLRSDNMKKKLLKYLQSLCEEHGDDPLQGLIALCDEMTKNLFVPCMAEIRLLKNSMRNRKDGKCTMSADKTSGVVKLNLTREKYNVRVITRVPKNYPEDALTFELQSKTYPHSVLYVVFPLLLCQRSQTNTIEQALTNQHHRTTAHKPTLSNTGTDTRILPTTSHVDVHWAGQREQH